MTQSLTDTTERVPIEEALKVGWDGTKKNFWMLLGMFLVVHGPYFVCAVIHAFLKESHPIIAWVVLMIGLLIQVPFSLGLVKVTIKIANGENVAFNDLLSVVSRSFSYVGAALMFFIALWIGLMLFVVPGAIIALKFQFYAYFIADKGMGPIEALKASWEVTKDVKLRLFLFYLVLGVVNTVGLLALIIGMIPASMVSVIATAFIYSRLVETAPLSADIPTGSLV